MLFEKTENTVISVDGMHCNHCKARVEAAIKSVKGVKKFEVSLEEATASVSYLASKTSPEAIADAINNIGFKAIAK